MVELIDTIKNSGVVGAGGAGFPTYAKIDKKADTIILNCAECEPLLKVHRQLLAKYAYEIVETFQKIAEKIEVKNIIIGVKPSYKKTVEALEAIHSSFPNVQLKMLPEIYPAGDEVVLIYETIKRVVPPGSIPIQIGVAVFNVETVFNIYQALQGKVVTDKYLTIAGEVKNPITIKVPIGTSVEEAVNLAGGAVIEEPQYIMGGPMTGKIVNGYDVITKTTNAILVLPKYHNVVRRKVKNISIDMKRAMSVCCQCQMCTDLCPRNLLGHPIAPHAFMRAATSGTTKDLAPFLDTMFCCSCGLCEMYACMQDLSPRTLITEYKNGLRQNGVPMPKEVELKPVNSTREYRTVPVARLTARLGLAQYNIEAPLQENIDNISRVKILFNQHIGAPAILAVKKEDFVEKGQIVALAVEGKLSVPVHASISGKVLEANEKYVILEAKI